MTLESCHRCSLDLRKYLSFATIVSISRHRWGVFNSRYNSQTGLVNHFHCLTPTVSLCRDTNKFDIVSSIPRFLVTASVTDLSNFLLKPQGCIFLSLKGITYSVSQSSQAENSGLNLNLFHLKICVSQTAIHHKLNYTLCYKNALMF